MARREEKPINPEDLKTVEGTVSRVTYENADTGFRVIRVDVKRGRQEVSETWCGIAPAIGPGMSVRATGVYENDGRFGEQLKLQSLVPVMPSSVEGLKKYLGSGIFVGIGEALAGRIVDKFGEKTIEMLDRSPEQLSLVRGLGGSKARTILESWNEQRAVTEIMVFLQQHGASPALATKIHKRYKSQAIEVVSRYPYRLALEVDGVGFKTADRIALSAGIAADSDDRAQAGVMHVLHEIATKGHCFMPWNALVAEAAAMLGRDPIAVEAAVRSLSSGGYVVVEQNETDESIVFEKRVWKSERAIAEQLALILGAPAAHVDDLQESAEHAILDFESRGIALAPAQLEAVRALPTSKVMVLTGGPGVGKAQPHDALVLTPRGWTTMGALVVGDEVIGSDGAPHRVTGVFEQGVKDVFCVMFDDGGSTECCDEHLWFTRTRRDRKRDRAGAARPLSEIRASMERTGGGLNHSVEFVSAVEFAPRGEALPLDPWLLGAFLGDGTTSGNTVMLHNPELDVRERIAQALPEGDRIGAAPAKDPLRVPIAGGKSSSDHARSKTSVAIERLGLLGARSYDKFVPECYKTASIDVRLRLLQGLCDTDGYVVPSSGKSIEYCTASRKLRDDVAFLVGSLGGRVSWVARETHYTKDGERHEGRISYRMILAFPKNDLTPVTTQKHLRAWIGGKNRIKTRFIKKVVPSERKPCRCISVDAADQLYVTDDFILTHNTTIVRALLFALEGAKLRVSLAAPTGRAAKRMQESTGRSAQTIHRLLDYDPASRRFNHNAETPLHADAVVIDEASMLDTRLAEQLFDAVPPDARLILVGDVDQLPSVGAGSVLRDVISSGRVPTVRLTQIFRQAKGSSISENAARINSGTPPVGDDTGANGGGFFVMEIDEPAAAAEKIVELVTKRIPSAFKIDPSDIQVLTPMHKGEVGTSALNERLQASLNPSGLEVKRGARVYRVGDRVMQLRNDYDREVFNGDMGYVVESPRAEEEDKRVLTVRIDGRDVAYLAADLDDLALAYASSIHKSQGSEYAAVVVPMMTAHYVMLSRNLLYTAVTRGKKLVVLITSPKAMRTALAETRKEERRTRLARRLAEA
jgi:ATP-dependent exoDNAse (exonuclease V) alpha subunit